MRGGFGKIENTILEPVRLCIDNRISPLVPMNFHRWCVWNMKEMLISFTFSACKHEEYLVIGVVRLVDLGTVLVDRRLDGSRICLRRSNTSPSWLITSRPTVSIALKDMER